MGVSAGIRRVPGRLALAKTAAGHRQRGRGSLPPLADASRWWRWRSGFWLQFPLAQAPRHLRGQPGGEGQGALRSEACASCPSIGSQRAGPPAQQCQPRGAKAPGTAKPAGSLLESQGPGRPAHLLLTASHVPVGGGLYAHPSGRGASHPGVLDQLASWQY